METSQPDPLMPPRFSVTDPVSRALDWAGQVLFRPFDIVKWLVLGFCAWLAALGEGGGGGGGSHWNLSRDDIQYRMGHAENWVRAHVDLVILLAILLFFAALVLWVLFTWLSSRGKFLFLDGVVHDRAAVVEPWQRFSLQGNSLFLFRLVLGILAGFVIGAAVLLMVLSLIASGLTDRDPGVAGIFFIFLWIAVLLGLILVFVLVALALNDFVVPIMWVRGCRVMEAWSEFLSLLSARIGMFVLYLLLKILIAVVIGVIACVVTCVTCCLAALPYIGTVILLPLHVFGRSFSIYFLSQFSPEYAPLAPDVSPPPDSPATAEAGGPA
jgi:hypothetical protein